MKTYPISVIRQAFHELIPCGSAVKVSIFVKKSRPLVVNAVVGNIHASPQGLKVSFYQVKYRRKSLFDLSVSVKDIRWLSVPLNMEALEKWCALYTKKIEAPKDLNFHTNNIGYLDEYLDM